MECLIFLGKTLGALIVFGCGLILLLKALNVGEAAEAMKSALDAHEADISPTEILRKLRFAEPVEICTRAEAPLAQGKVLLGDGSYEALTETLVNGTLVASRSPDRTVRTITYRIGSSWLVLCLTHPAEGLPPNKASLELRDDTPIRLSVEGDGVKIAPALPRFLSFNLTKRYEGEVHFGVREVAKTRKGKETEHATVTPAQAAEIEAIICWLIERADRAQPI